MSTEFIHPNVNYTDKPTHRDQPVIATQQARLANFHCIMMTTPSAFLSTKSNKLKLKMSY